MSDTTPELRTNVQYPRCCTTHHAGSMNVTELDAYINQLDTHVKLCQDARDVHQARLIELLLEEGK